MAASPSGVLVVDKAPGFTSFQIVAHLRRLLRASKVGHGGTLDPQATGVLPILVNEATKLMAYLAEHTKEYLATARLGVVTDTQDLTGAVLQEAPVPELSRASLEAALARFVGEIRQVPPMYSALHVGGRRLYEWARRGVEVEREPRVVTIHALTLESAEFPRFTIRVVCGRGTYVRTLCADIGQAIGCGAALERLVRTRVGPYSLDDALLWAEIMEARDPAPIWARLLPPDSAVGHLPALRLSEDTSVALLRGQRVPIAEPVTPGLVRLYGASGSFLGLGRVSQDGKLVKPERILYEGHLRPRVLPA